MRKKGKRLLSLLLSVSMMTGMALTGAVPASAGNSAQGTSSESLFTAIATETTTVTEKTQEISFTLTSDSDLSDTSIYGVSGDTNIIYTIGMDVNPVTTSGDPSLEIDPDGTWSWSGADTKITVPVTITQGSASKDFTFSPTLSWKDDNGETQTEKDLDVTVTVTVEANTPAQGDFITKMTADPSKVTKATTSITFTLTSAADLSTGTYKVTADAEFQIGITADPADDGITLSENTEWTFDDQKKTITVPVTVTQGEEEKTVTFTPTLTPKGKDTTAFDSAKATVTVNKADAVPGEASIAAIGVQDTNSEDLISTIVIPAGADEVARTLEIIAKGDNLINHKIGLICDNVRLTAEDAVAGENNGKDAHVATFNVIFPENTTTADEVYNLTPTLDGQNATVTCKVTVKGKSTESIPSIDKVTFDPEKVPADGTKNLAITVFGKNLSANNVVLEPVSDFISDLTFKEVTVDGSVKYTAVVAANPNTAERKVSFAVGIDGTELMQYPSLMQEGTPDAAPSIDEIIATPESLPAAGGTVTLAVNGNDKLTSKLVTFKAYKDGNEEVITGITPSYVASKSVPGKLIYTAAVPKYSGEESRTIIFEASIGGENEPVIAAVKQLAVSAKITSIEITPEGNIPAAGMIGQNSLTVKVVGEGLAASDIKLSGDEKMLTVSSYGPIQDEDGVSYKVFVKKNYLDKARTITLTATLVSNPKETKFVTKTQDGGSPSIEGVSASNSQLDATGGRADVTVKGAYLTNPSSVKLTITSDDPNAGKVSNVTGKAEAPQYLYLHYSNISFPANTSDHDITYTVTATLGDVTETATVTVLKKGDTVLADVTDTEFVSETNPSTYDAEKDIYTTDYRAGDADVILSGALTANNYKDVKLTVDKPDVVIGAPEFSNGTIYYSVMIPANNTAEDIAYSFAVAVKGETKKTITVVVSKPVVAENKPPVVIPEEHVPGQTNAKINAVIPDLDSDVQRQIDSGNTVKVTIPVKDELNQVLNALPTEVKTAEVSLSLPSALADSNVVPSIVVDATVFKDAKVDLTINVDIGDGATAYTWNIPKGSIPDGKPVDLAIQGTNTPNRNIQNDSAFNTATSGANANKALQLDFANHITFNKSITVTVSIATTPLRGLSHVALYCWKNGRLEEEQNKLTVNTNGTVNLPLTHNSTFVLLPVVSGGGKPSGGTSSGSPSSSNNAKSIIVKPGEAVSQNATGSLLLDTKSYTMAPGGMYDIKALLNGANPAEMKVYSSRDGVAKVVLLPNGNYRITGVAPGTAYIVFDVYRNGVVVNHASVRVDVAAGAVPRGEKNTALSIF